MLRVEIASAQPVSVLGTRTPVPALPTVGRGTGEPLSQTAQLRPMHVLLVQISPTDHFSLLDGRPTLHSVSATTRSALLATPTLRPDPTLQLVPTLYIIPTLFAAQDTRANLCTLPGVAATDS